MVEELSKEEMTNLEEESFNPDFTEDRFQSLSIGDIIDAKVILVRDSEVFVDIGGKSDMVIPLEELTNSQVTSAKDVVKNGDTIKVMVVKAGGEDGVRLSRRRIEQEEVWVKLEEVYKEGQIISGTVTELVKGGLSLKINGLKAFMPASQVSLSFVSDLSNLIGQTFPVKILEFDREKRRLLVSRRVLLEAEKAKAETEFFTTVNEGERKVGKVTRITDFGAFVDLGSGIEGLIHISELSWNRVKSVREVLKENQEVEVLITKVDKEKKKISLSLKQIQTHPWLDAIKQFTEGQVYPGIVMRLESFGAFIRLAPGLEGLAHISQLSDKRINKPDEVVKVGDEVQVKILKIDSENRKISLSLKQITEDKEKEEIDGFLENQEETSMTQSLGDLIKQ